MQTTKDLDIKDLEVVLTEKLKKYIVDPSVNIVIATTKGQKSIAILGEVLRPGTYGYSGEITLLEIISRASGYKDTAKTKKVRIVRYDSDNKRKVSYVNVKKIFDGTSKDIKLANGDVVYFSQRFFASGGWFVRSVMPWITLVTVFVLIIPA